MDQTETSVFRAGDTGSRWRTLLDRARHRPGVDEVHDPALDPVPYDRVAPPGPSQPPPPAMPPSMAPASGPPADRWAPPSAPGSVDALLDSLRRNLGKSRVIAFANPKGGVHKTTATVLTAATLGSARGRGVLAWDDNELRGTLGLRAGTARHARTIRHLVGDLHEVEHGGGQLVDRMDDYLRHTRDGSFDVLAGDEDPRIARRLDASTVRRVLSLLACTHDVVCVDTGNNVESPNWRTILEEADQLVVTTLPREDAAFSADWMLDLLIDEGMGKLVQNAVTLISCPTPNPGELLDDFTGHFMTRTREVTVVPYDPALEPGSMIEYSSLQATTRMAWLKAAATITARFE